MSSDFKTRRECGGVLKIGPKGKKKGGEGTGSLLYLGFRYRCTLWHRCPFTVSLAHKAAQVPTPLLNSHLFTLVSSCLLFPPLFRSVSFPIFCILLDFLTSQHLSPPCSGLDFTQTSEVTAMDSVRLSLHSVLLWHEAWPTIGISARNSVLPSLTPRSCRDLSSPLRKFLLSEALLGVLPPALSASTSHALSVHWQSQICLHPQLLPWAPGQLSTCWTFPPEGPAENSKLRPKLKSLFSPSLVLSIVVECANIHPDPWLASTFHI